MIDSYSAATTFIEKAPWRFASTMQYVPHSYTVRGQTPDADFDSFVRLIRDQGRLANYGSFRTAYLKLGKHKYWTMGEPLGVTTIINRCHVDDEFGEVRDITGEEIEDRRNRWKALDKEGKTRWWREALERC